MTKAQHHRLCRSDWSLSPRGAIVFHDRGMVAGPIQGRSDLSFWLGVSMLLYFFWANLSWLAIRITPQRQ